MQLQYSVRSAHINIEDSLLFGVRMLLRQKFNLLLGLDVLCEQLRDMDIILMLRLLLSIVLGHPVKLLVLLNKQLIEVHNVVSVGGDYHYLWHVVPLGALVLLALQRCHD